MTLLSCKCCCFSNVNYSAIMLTSYWSLSQQGDLQPHTQSKACKMFCKIGDLSQSLSEAVWVKSCKECVFLMGYSHVFILRNIR